MTTDSYNQSHIPPTDPWAYGNRSRYLFELRWYQLRWESGAAGHSLVLGDGNPRDWANIEDLESREGRVADDFRTIILSSGVLQRMGFAYDEPLHETTIPDVNSLNAHAAEQRAAYGDAGPYYDFVRVNQAADTPVLSYARENAEGHMPMGVADMGIHDVLAHMLDHLAVPQSIGGRISATLRYLLALKEDPILGGNSQFQKFVDALLGLWADSKDNDMSGRTLIHGLTTGNYMSPLEARIDPGQSVTLASSEIISKYLGVYAAGSVRQSAEAVLAAFNNPDRTVRYDGSEGFPATNVTITEEQLAVLRRLAAAQDDSVMTVRQIVDEMGSPEHRRFMLDQRLNPPLQ
jgi:hypothetical protein